MFDKTWEPWKAMCKVGYQKRIMDAAQAAHPDRDWRYAQMVKHAHCLASGQALEEGHAIETCDHCSLAAENYRKMWAEIPDDWKAKP